MEVIHAVTYFDSESRSAAKLAGAKGFWMGYFGFRAAPLGTVSAGVIEAAFANFAPRMVARAVPDIWELATPETLLSARQDAAGRTLRRVLPPNDWRLDEVCGLLDAAVTSAHPMGRPLFASNRTLHSELEGLQRLWQLCTTAREHRGDGHVMALALADLDGCEAHVMQAAATGVPVELLRDNRGWNAQEWSEAGDRLQLRGFVDATGALTDAGRELRSDLEGTTDRLAESLVDSLDAQDRELLLSLLEPLASAVLAAEIVPFPNPMGLTRDSTS